MTVRNYLQTLINDGLTAGDPVPSERELCELFDVSRMTVRQAIDTLIVDGVLERQQGRGTFVAPPKLDLQLRLTSFTEEMNRRGMLAGSRVLAAETIPANDEFADALELSLGAPVHYLRRLRTADSDPMAIEESWLSADTLPNFLELAGRRSLYATLLEQDKRPNWGEDSIEARSISPEDAALLEVPVNTPGLYITRRTYRDQQAIVYSNSLYRADRYSLWVPVANPSPSYTAAQLNPKKPVS